MERDIFIILTFSANGETPKCLPQNLGTNKVLFQIQKQNKWNMSIKAKPKNEKIRRFKVFQNSESFPYQKWNVKEKINLSKS
jgi:hypothetical protein